MTMVLIAALLTLLQEESPGGVRPALLFLARHQREDGSWGDPPASCSCARQVERTAVPEDPAEIERLVRELGQDGAERRARASERLRGFGQRALPYLLEGARDPDPEIRTRCAELRRDLLPYAPGAGDVELTSLAVLAFLQAGYTPYSKDLQDGLCFGTVVKKALKWLHARQQETGACDAKDPVADTVAALAFSECFGMIGGGLYKAAAEAAVGRVAAREARDTRAMIWKGMMFKSAELSEVPVDRKLAEANLDALRERPADSLQRAGLCILSIFVKKKKGDPDLGGIHLLDPLRLDAETLYLGTMASFQFDGPHGPHWSVWKPQYQGRLLPLQVRGEKGCERGSWTGVGFRGRLQATTLNAMNFEFYYNH